MTNEKRKQAKKDRRRKVLLIFTVIILTVILAFLSIFNMTNVTVSGSTKYSDAEIKAFCTEKFLINNTLLFTLMNKTIDLSEIPYLDSATVELVDRNTVHISVCEIVPFGKIDYNGTDYYFDKSGVLLGTRKATDEVNDDVFKISGIKATRLNPGEPMFDDTTVLDTINVVKSIIEKHDVQPDSYEVTEDGGLILHFGKVRANIGKDQMLEDKLMRFYAILPEIKNLSGELHLERLESGAKNIVFSEDKVSGKSVSDTKKVEKNIPN